MAVTNATAFYDTATVMDIKKFYSIGPKGVCTLGCRVHDSLSCKPWGFFLSLVIHPTTKNPHPVALNSYPTGNLNGAFVS